MKRADVIDNARIQAGDVIVGLSSSGQASYEKEYNGGMGSNGLTSARHDVFANYLAQKYPESYDASIPADLVYSGGLRLTDEIEEWAWKPESWYSPPPAPMLQSYHR